MSTRITWPEGKHFAFTIYDDTDLATLDNVKRIYSFLAECGLKTTKSAWPLKGEEEPELGGATCEDPDYLDWLLDLQKQGFEIGYHNATYHSSRRDDTIMGIEKFSQLFQNNPLTMAQHMDNKENIYWGSNRFNGINRFLYNILTRFKQHNQHHGHIEGNDYFWGDICKARVKYVRNFVFSNINTLKKCPYMPYHDPKRAYVNYWFASSGGRDISVQSFNKVISEANQDRLEQEGGACIMYGFFAFGFLQDNNKIEPRFESLMKRLSRKNGWFVPVATLLDYLLEVNGKHVITNKERSQLERTWLWDKFTGLVKK